MIDPLTSTRSSLGFDLCDVHPTIGFLTTGHRQQTARRVRSHHSAAGADETHLVEVVRPIGRRQEETEGELSHSAALVLHADAGVVAVVAVFQVARRAIALAAYQIATARHEHCPRAAGEDP